MRSTLATMKREADSNEAADPEDTPWKQLSSRKRQRLPKPKCEPAAHWHSVVSNVFACVFSKRFMSGNLIKAPPYPTAQPRQRQKPVMPL